MKDEGELTWEVLYRGQSSLLLRCTCIGKLRQEGCHHHGVAERPGRWRSSPHRFPWHTEHCPPCRGWRHTTTAHSLSLLWCTGGTSRPGSGRGRCTACHGHPCRTCCHGPLTPDTLVSSWHSFRPSGTGQCRPRQHLRHTRPPHLRSCTWCIDGTACRHT